MTHLSVEELGINHFDGRYLPCEVLHCDLDGIKGDKNAGMFTTVGVQEADRLKKMGINITREQYVLNGRQVSMISNEEMAIVAGRLGISQIHLSGEQLRANVVVSFPSEDQVLSKIKRGAYIVFHGNGRAILEVHWENLPCVVAGEYIALSCGIPEIENKFPKAAYGLRGLVLKVFRPGKIKLSDTASIHEW